MDKIDLTVAQAHWNMFLTTEGVELANKIMTHDDPFLILVNFTGLSLNKIADILDIPRTTLKDNVRKRTKKFDRFLALNLDFFIGKYINKNYVNELYIPYLSIERI